MDTVEFNAQNIKCMGCASAIREGLSAIAGVQTVEVNVAQGHVSVSGQNLDSTLLEQKMTELGYPLA